MPLICWHSFLQRRNHKSRSAVLKRIKVTSRLQPLSPEHQVQRTRTVNRAITWSRMARAPQKTCPSHPTIDNINTQDVGDYDKIITEIFMLVVSISIGSCSFSVSGPTVWNALPDYFRNPTLPIDVFKSCFKTFLFAHY